jgi:iron complex outermembrane receptor protein
VFRYNIRNLISQELDAESGLLVFTNSGRVTSEGFEFALDRVWENGATARASYSSADVDDVGTGLPFQNAPRSLLKFGVTAPLGSSGLLAGVEARYVGSREGVTGGINPYKVVNLTVTWPAVRENLELAVTLRNLFDEHYGDPPGPAFVQNEIEQDGRTVLFEASYRF